MTSPDQQVPTRGYTATTVYQLQNVDPDEIGRAQNVDMRDQLEAVRGNLFTNLLGGFLSVPAALAPVINGIFNGWFGDGGVGDPLQVQYTIEAIKDAVINGYVVHTVVWDEVWEKPENLVELTVIGIGGGRNGSDGSSTAGGPGGTGGASGGYIAQTFNPADVPDSVPIVIGNAGQPTRFGDLFEVDGGVGGISSQFGYTPTNSTPGRGGDGGSGVSSNIGSVSAPGKDGGSSAAGAGGAGGIGRSGSSGDGGPGGAGANVSAAATTKSGGGGGGGGGGGPAASLVTGTRWGGAGGPGGYPGAGGGGGGGRGGAGTGASTGAGAGGPGAKGILWIYYKIATLPVPEVA